MALKYKYDKETLTALLIGADEEDRTVEIPKTVSYYKKLYDVRIGSFTDSDSIDFSNTKIKKIIISDGFTSIEDDAFKYCTSLTSITIPDSVTSIGKWAFRDCSSLTSITIPDSVTSIGDGAFSGCKNLRKFKGKYVAKNGRCIIVGSRLTAYANASGTSFNIPDSVTSIGAWAFNGCSSLTSITIPNSVASIGFGAFDRCSSLTSITIPNSVTSIGDNAFRFCSSLTSITIPDSITSIKHGTFSFCRSITSITIPNSVTWIRYAAFARCESLNVEICNEDGDVIIQPGAFESTAKIKYLGKDAKVTIQTKSEKEETEPKKKGFFTRLFGK